MRTTAASARCGSRPGSDDPDRTADRGTVDAAAARGDPDADPVAWDDRPAYQRAVQGEVASFADAPRSRSGRRRARRGDDARRPPRRGRVRGDRRGRTGTGGAEARATDRPFVNVSTGPRIAVVGAAIARMAVGARPYGVEPESYTHDVEAEPLTEGAAGVVDLPLYPIDAPTRDQVAVLGRLRERGYVELESVGRSDNVTLTPTASGSTSRSNTSSTTTPTSDRRGGTVRRIGTDRGVAIVRSVRTVAAVSTTDRPR